MKKIVKMFLATILFIFFATNVQSSEAQKSSQSGKSEAPVRFFEKFQKIEGDIVSVDTGLSIITVKKSDGSVITMKAIKPKAQEEIRNLKAGEKISVLCKESKKDGLVLVKVIKENSEKVKKKGKNKK